MKKIYKLLSILIFSFCITSNAFAKEDTDGFTINYENVSIIEYVNFVGQITNINFIYNDEDLNFKVTVVSKDPITKDSVISTLIQVLRIHGLSMIEQNNNIIISKNSDVKELAQVVTDQTDNLNPIITKVFKVQNAKVETLATILRPMISNAAILEISSETRQLIITDVTTNIKKISDLIESIDSEDSPLLIETYKVQDNHPSNLIQLTQQIIEPMIEGNPFLLVPQSSTRMVYIVSTPALANKAISILQSLDLPPEKEIKSLENQNVFLYTPKYKSEEEIDSSLNQIVQNLKDAGFPESGLIETIQTVQWIKDTHSFLFTGSQNTLVKIQNILASIDIPGQQTKHLKITYFLYKLQNVSGQVIEDDLEQLADNLRSQEASDSKLLNVIENAKWVKETNSILLTGDAVSIEEAKNIIQNYDTPRGAITTKGNFLMYSPKNVSLDDLKDSLEDVAKNLKNSGLADESLLESIETMKVVDSTNSIAFTGNQETLAKIKNILESIDVTSPSKQPIQQLGKTNFWVYQIQNATPQQLINSLKSITDDLVRMDSSNKLFIKALKSMKYVKNTNSLVFTGSQDALERIKPLVEKFDIKTGVKEAITYFVYKPKYLTGPEIENVLNDFAEQLKITGAGNEDLFETISSMQFSDKTNSLVFTGEASSIEEVKGLLELFDVADHSHPSTQEISGLEDLGFLVYKLQYHKGNEIQEALRQIAKDLKDAQGEAAVKFKLVKSIDSIQWIQVTNSLLCSGDSETLAKLKELINNLDVPLKQVFIELLVIETTLSNALTFGLDWGSKFKYKDQAVLGTGNMAPVQSGSSNAFADSFNKITNTRTPVGTDLNLSNGFDLGIIGDILMHGGKSFLSLGSLLQALQTDNETSIVMTPKIIAQDGKTSKIFSGTNFPYLGSVVQNQSQNTLVTSNVEYRDIGMNLVITPILGNSDTVTMTIELESTAKPDDTTQQSLDLGQVNGITTTKTTMSTAVHVPNKNFLVLSGMVTDTKNRSKSGVPCLGGIPIIGAAFSKDDKSENRDNIVIFLRPHIINSYEDMLNITENQEDYFRDQTGTPNLEKEYDESVEIMKSYEND